MKTKPLQILLIEDNPTDTLLLERMLEDEHDLSLTTVERLNEGLAQLENRHFDAVLSDWACPIVRASRRSAAYIRNIIKCRF